MKELLNKPLPQIADDIQKKLENPQITLTPFDCRETILYDCSLQQEIGYAQFPNGDWLVSMTCPMPGITADMIEWWFWWHCQEKLCYQVWFPGEHISNTYHKKDRSYFEQETMPPFQANSQCLVERVGKIRMPLQIDFITPEEFGFGKKAMKDNHISVIVCGHVSAFGSIMKHTEMAHIYKQTEEGLFLISRFWIGKKLEKFFAQENAFDKRNCSRNGRSLLCRIPKSGRNSAYFISFL